MKPIMKLLRRTAMIPALLALGLFLSTSSLTYGQGHSQRHERSDLKQHQKQERRELKYEQRQERYGQGHAGYYNNGYSNNGHSQYYGTAHNSRNRGNGHNNNGQVFYNNGRGYDDDRYNYNNGHVRDYGSYNSRAHGGHDVYQHR